MRPRSSPNWTSRCPFWRNTSRRSTPHPSSALRWRWTRHLGPHLARHDVPHTGRRQGGGVAGRGGLPGGAVGRRPAPRWPLTGLGRAREVLAVPVCSRGCARHGAPPRDRHRAPHTGRRSLRTWGRWLAAARPRRGSGRNGSRCGLARDRQHGREHLAGSPRRAGEQVVAGAAKADAGADAGDGGSADHGACDGSVPSSRTVTPSGKMKPGGHASTESTSRRA